MASQPAMKTSLQRDVFLPIGERLVGVVSVVKPGKKKNVKKASYLCATVTTERPIQPKIYLVRKAEKGDGYKCKQTWDLKELTVVDGKDEQHENLEFDLTFEKVYKWVASNVSEKDNFMACMWRLCQRYVQEKPSFTNIPLHLREDTLKITDSVTVEDAPLPEEDYEAISNKEESDLEKLMGQCEFSISNAEAFSEQLSQDLSVLDGANIHSMMESEDQVLQLMNLLDNAIREATKVETQLDKYDGLLKNVQDSMEMMKDKDMLIQVQNTNHQHLMQELDGLITHLDLSQSNERALLDGDLASANGILECTQAAEVLQQCVLSVGEISNGLNQMAAVQEQIKRFNRYKKSFAQRLGRQLNKLFIQQGNESTESATKQSNELKITRHHSRHRDLAPYGDLMFWLKNADQDSFVKLKQVYTASVSRVYEKEIKEFFESARQKLVMKTERKGLNVPHHLTTSSSSLEKIEGRHRANSIQSLDSHSSMGSFDVSKNKFDQIFELILCELEPVCLEEQDFCVHFFHLMKEKTTPGKRKDEVHGNAKQQEKHVDAEVRKMMTEIFSSIEHELMEFSSFGDSLDFFNAMYLLTRMSQHVSNAQDTGSFLAVTFASSLVHIKRNFDKYILSEINTIEEFKVHKKTKCGIIPFVRNFETFAHRAETVFHDSERRVDLEKAYIRIMRAILLGIQRVAEEHPKTPKDVIMMENFHHLYDALSQLKIVCLESERKEAKQKYNDCLQAYVTNFLGRPMEKVNMFFDGIESRIAAGVKAEEVGYQLAYSKNELRKVIKEYPGKEVKKGLESLCKKVDKHLCEEENLFQVVWHSMQDEFIKQYKHFENLIKLCYPASQITFEISINEILEYFSDIAQA